MATVLVIDDEEMIRTLAEKILLRDSHKVLLAENSNQAISLFVEHINFIDILLIDMNLDDMNGFEVLATLRKQQPNIPGVISSGNSYSHSDIPENINSNIYFLEKPYRASELSDLINSIVVPT